MPRSIRVRFQKLFSARPPVVSSVSGSGDIVNIVHGLADRAELKRFIGNAAVRSGMQIEVAICLYLVDARSRAVVRTSAEPNTVPSTRPMNGP